MTLPYPSEEIEQTNFVQYLELRGLAFSAIPNSTFTKSWSVKNRNTRTGLRAGLPDMLVVLPGVGLVFVEMKKQKGGVVSSYQKEWIERLNTCPGVAAHVAKGCDAAIAIIESYLPSTVGGTTF